MRFLRYPLLFVLLFFFYSGDLLAQKKKLEPKDYGQWQRISTAKISPHGNWFAYTVSLVDGDGWLIIKPAEDNNVQEHKFMHARRASFSPNSKWAAFLIGVSEEEKERLKEQNKVVCYDLGLLNLTTAKVDTFKKVQSYEFSNDGSFLAMKKYKAEEVKTKGTDLVLRNLEEDTDRLIGNVSEFEFNESGDKLGVILDASEKLGNGVHLHDLETGTVTVLESDTTEYSDLSWNRDGTSLAFLKAQKNETYEEPTHHIYAFQDIDKTPSKYMFNQDHYTTFADSMRIVDHRSLEWSEDDQTLFFGTKKWAPAKDQPSDSVSNDKDPSNVEVWHWKDVEIQPMQKIMANYKKRKNHLAAWHLDQDKFVQLGSDKFRELQLTGDQKHAVAYTSKPYEPRFKENWMDIFIMDVSTAKPRKILDRHEYVRTSPGGNYLLYFKDNDWWTYDIKSKKHTNISKNIDTRFEDFTRVNGRENPRPFGRGHWSKNDEWVLVYDQYDVYKLWTDGSKYKKLTNGAPNKIKYRQAPFDYDTYGKGLSDDQPIYLRMYGEFTKDRGYARLTGDKLQPLVYEAKRYDRLAKADSTDIFIFQTQTATDSPNFYKVDASFQHPVAMTNTNPQQDEFYWADDELVTFTNEQGEKLQGRLLYPANYDPNKQYPMITYIYEKRSQTMHSYSLPSDKSAYNFRRFSSEGYFVFQPDITYELSNPGFSAVKSVVPAVEKVLESGMINENQLGLTGHSWGAYQTTFIITQTDLFKSAVAGAPLTNMISMYNSIYWNSGETDARIFEIRQGRFPEPWWKDWDNYVANSPIFNIEDVTTPLLVEFGTDDGAVDFNQGVELYNTMRRMQNPFVMLVYEGENHGLAREENQIDYATRALQWHNHYLLGEEAPEWIEQGLPYLERPEIKQKNGK